MVGEEIIRYSAAGCTNHDFWEVWLAGLLCMAGGGGSLEISRMWNASHILSSPHPLDGSSCRARAEATHGRSQRNSRLKSPSTRASACSRVTLRRGDFVRRC